MEAVFIDESKSLVLFSIHKTKNSKPLCINVCNGADKSVQLDLTSMKYKISNI